MTSLIILLTGAFWEASMDIIASERNYKRSIWFLLATYLDKKGFKRWGHGFWDYRVAWRNKWKNGDPKQGERFLASASVLVTFCDGWHLVKFFWFMHFIFAVVLYEPMTKYMALDIFIYYAMFGAAHTFTILWMQVRPYVETEEDKLNKTNFDKDNTF